MQANIFEEIDKIRTLNLAIANLEKTGLQESTAKMSKSLKDIVQPAMTKLNIHKVHGGKEVRGVYKDLKKALAAAKHKKDNLEESIKELPRKIINKRKVTTPNKLISNII